MTLPLALLFALASFTLQGLSLSSAWTAVPEAGATSTTAYVTVENPTMYDVYVVSATADASASAELREPDGQGGTRAASSFTVTAYESLEMAATGPHLLLKDLTRPLKAGDVVHVVLVTDGGEQLKAAATVK